MAKKSPDLNQQLKEWGKDLELLHAKIEKLLHKINKKLDGRKYQIGDLGPNFPKFGKRIFTFNSDRGGSIHYDKLAQRFIILLKGRKNFCYMESIKILPKKRKSSNG